MEAAEKRCTQARKGCDGLATPGRNDTVEWTCHGVSGVGGMNL